MVDAGPQSEGGNIVNQMVHSVLGVDCHYAETDSNINRVGLRCYRPFEASCNVNSMAQVKDSGVFLVRSFALSSRDDS